MRAIDWVMRVVVPLPVLAGCVFSDHTVDTPYSAASTPLPAAAQHTVYVSVAFVPTLPLEPRSVGVKKNGYGTETANLFVTPDPRGYLHAGLSAELARAGFTVVPTPSAGAHTVSVVVEQLFVEPGMSAFTFDVTGIARLDVTIELAGTGRRFERRFVGLSESTEMFVSGSDLEDRLTEATRHAFGEAVFALHQLLSDPPVASPPPGAPS